ncbi:MAG: hypothetical protein RR561_01480 [Peptostreptococcus sp.]|uniref:Uncharacterized protein n=1 Tax=Peptostreptococcus russellii TaxID=215200 RepID=A0A2P7Q2F7_9FIRM|nr:hypothetical protein [Peptostreptococcus russellii]PSJ32130.1 hypothetical protein UF10_01680 [Peptostreptococcus russellii]
MECKLYYPQNEELIVLTYYKKWEKKIKYIEKSYSSFMGSYVVFFHLFDASDRETINIYHDDEKILDSIIREAVYENYIDLSKYYQYDQLDLDT